MKQKLMVVCGGQSSEHIVSRMSCTSVMNNLNKENYDVTLVGIDQDGSWYILDQNQEDLAKDTWLENAKALQDVFGLLKQQDVVLPILHGAFGEDGTIQGLFELAGVPYVGCRVLASAVSMDKIYTKKILETAGIPQVKSLYVKKRYDGKLVVVNKQFDEIEDIEKTVEKELGFPCFIKASRSGSSVGCYRCDHKEDLMTKLIEASKYDRHIVVEECVDCIELETAVLGNDDAPKQAGCAAAAHTIPANSARSAVRPARRPSVRTAAGPLPTRPTRLRSAPNAASLSEPERGAEIWQKTPRITNARPAPARCGATAPAESSAVITAALLMM